MSKKAPVTLPKELAESAAVVKTRMRLELWILPLWKEHISSLDGLETSKYSIGRYMCFKIWLALTVFYKLYCKHFPKGRPDSDPSIR